MVGVFELVAQRVRDFSRGRVCPMHEVEMRFVRSFDSTAAADRFMSRQQRLDGAGEFIMVDMDFPDQMLFHRTFGGWE